MFITTNFQEENGGVVNVKDAQERIVGNVHTARTCRNMEELERRKNPALKGTAKGWGGGGGYGCCACIIRMFCLLVCRLYLEQSSGAGKVCSPLIHIYMVVGPNEL